jgi:hypothetical protein
MRGVLLEVLSGLLAGCGRPLVLQQALKALDPSSGYSIEAGLALAVSLAFISWVENWARYAGAFEFTDLGVNRCAAALVQLVTTKTVRLRAGAAAVGQESSLIGTDILGSLPCTYRMPTHLHTLTTSRSLRTLTTIITLSPQPSPRRSPNGGGVARDCASPPPATKPIEMTTAQLLRLADCQVFPLGVCAAATLPAGVATLLYAIVRHPHTRTPSVHHLPSPLILLPS